MPRTSPPTAGAPGARNRRHGKGGMERGQSSSRRRLGQPPYPRPVCCLGTHLRLETRRLSPDESALAHTCAMTNVVGAFRNRHRPGSRCAAVRTLSRLPDQCAAAAHAPPRLATASAAGLCPVGRPGLRCGRLGPVRDQPLPHHPKTGRRAGWVRSSWPKTPRSGARWRSRCCPRVPWASDRPGSG